MTGAGLIRGIILEGGSTAGKTSVLRALKRLNALDDEGERCVVVLGEHYSQVLHAVGSGFITLAPDEHLQLLEQNVAMLEQLHGWARRLGPASRRSRGLFYILERFHLNHRQSFPDTDSARITEIEQRLAALGAKCVLLTVSPTAVEERFIRSRGKAWEMQVLQSHASIAAACDAYSSTQESLRALAATSAIPTVEIVTDKAEWEIYAERVMAELDHQRPPAHAEAGPERGSQP